MNLRCLISVFLFFAIHIEMYAQDYSFKNLTAADGLPSMTVFEIDQDSKGNIWFGTEGGICKYDGYSYPSDQPPIDYKE